MAEPGPVSWAGPAHVDFYFILFYFYLFIIIYYNIKIFKKNEKFKKKSKNPLKKNCDFSQIFFYQFCIISDCIFTNPVLKYLFFFEIFQKKNKQKYILFSCIRPNPKKFPSIFSLKDCIFLMF